MERASSGALRRLSHTLGLVVNKAVVHWILSRRRGEHPTSLYCHAITRIVLLPLRVAPLSSWGTPQDPHLSCLCEV
jgi:hypothetical protein